MPLDLVVPDLLLPADAPDALREVRMPALERWLARADRARRAEGSVNALLASAYGLPSPAPYAAVALAAEGAPREGTWLRADPVHLRVDNDAVALHHPAVLGITREESGALLETLQHHFRDDALEFIAPAPERWYVRVPEAEVPNTVSLDDALGRNVFGLLPRGAGKFNWPSALTEVQMIFNGHEVNARREAEGRPAINSVWFWGEGAGPANVAATYALVYADDPFPRGLAALSQTRSAPLPTTVRELDAVPAKQSALAIVDGLTAPLHRGDAAEWARRVQKLDEDWFVDLKVAIDRFDGVRIILPAGRDTLVAQVTASTRWRLFRSVQPLTAY
jgi:hypothetical protein